MSKGEQRVARHRIEALAGLFPAWSDDWIILDDGDIIVVDKPPFVSTHAPDDKRKDDVVSRLQAWLSKGGPPPYLGVHQRLDRDTSGVLLFARRKPANASLAKQFEGRTVKKKYVAVVDGKLRVPRDGALRHTLFSERDGRVRAEVQGSVEASTSKGQDAVTRVREIARRGSRALIEARPETGRTHQIRAQLAAAGAPIVGDVLYGGVPAPRLMLHATELELLHPISQTPLVLSSDTPRELDGALMGSALATPLRADIAERVKAAARRRYGLYAGGDTDAFRIVNGDGDGLPGVAVDIYGDHLVTHLSDAEIVEDLVFDALDALHPRSIYVKRRPKDASRIVDSRRDEFAPRAPVRGEAPADGVLTIEEAGVPFEVRLGDGLSTGIFLDQRENRRRVRELAKGGRVLNLFAYTGAFSVVAALGGARESISVDASRANCDWTRRNLARVGADPSAHIAIEADCFRYLDGAGSRGDTFDLVILDPPSFATTKTSRFSADGGYVALAALALRVVVRQGGLLLACTNHQGIVQAKFRRFLHEAAREANAEIVQMKDLPAPEDFPPVPGREPHLKSLLVKRGR